MKPTGESHVYTEPMSGPTNASAQLRADSPAKSPTVAIVRTTTWLLVNPNSKVLGRPGNHLGLLRLTQPYSEPLEFSPGDLRFSCNSCRTPGGHSPEPGVYLYPDAHLLPAVQRREEPLQVSSSQFAKTFHCWISNRLIALDILHHHRLPLGYHPP